MTRALTEEQRTVIAADVAHPVLGVGSDADIAADHGVRPVDVRRMRRELRLDMDTRAILARALELAELVDWDGPIGDLAEGAIAQQVAVERERQALLDARMNEGDGRSAGRTVSRSRAPAEAHEGTSGRKGPEVMATARSHGGRSRWAAEKRDG